MFFTQDDFRKIEEYLKLKSKKDSDFDKVSQVTSNDTVVIVQGTDNKAVNVGTFIKTGMEPKTVTQDKLSDEVVRRFENSEQNINEIDQTIALLQERSQILNNLISQLQDAIAIGIGTQEGLPHVILTQEEYDSLTSKDSNTIYLIVNRNTWVFGDNFPIILS